MRAPWCKWSVCHLMPLNLLLSWFCKNPHDAWTLSVVSVLVFQLFKQLLLHRFNFSDQRFPFQLLAIVVVNLPGSLSTRIVVLWVKWNIGEFNVWPYGAALSCCLAMAAQPARENHQRSNVQFVCWLVPLWSSIRIFHILRVTASVTLGTLVRCKTHAGLQGGG